MKTIAGFQKEYRWLSNFWPAEVELDGIKFPSVEHAYVAAKINDLSVRKSLVGMKAGEVKKFGRGLKVRDDWEQVKLPVMRNLVRQKFQHEELKQKLLATGEAELIEENYWNDTFWGVCKGVGENNLGKIIMEIREEIRKS